jgi:prepilin-type processing-associated H-X9-DG protein
MLIQLLVLLALLGILIGLLLPAVAKIRQAAARAQSQNNLKQLALAMHNYESANNKLPEGVNGNGFSVHTLLLPYIEQENVYRLIDLKKEPMHKDNQKARELVIKTFLSPLDTVAGAAGPEPVPSGLFGTNYFGNAGAKPALEKNNGVFFDGGLRLVDITDGTSNTVAFLEGLRGDGQAKATNVARQHVRLSEKELAGVKEASGVKEWDDGEKIAGDRGWWWIRGAFLQTNQTITRGVNDAKPDVDCGGKGGLSAPRTLIGVVNIAMADGSVRALNENVTFKVWQAISTRNGGEDLSKDW